MFQGAFRDCFRSIPYFPLAVTMSSSFVVRKTLNLRSACNLQRLVSAIRRYIKKRNRAFLGVRERGILLEDEKEREREEEGERGRGREKIGDGVQKVKHSLPKNLQPVGGILEP